MVPATAVPKTNAAMKFQKAAQATARNGVSTRVETTVAIEFAASCHPLENSNTNVSPMTVNNNWKLSTVMARGRVICRTSQKIHTPASTTHTYLLNGYC